MLVTVIDTVEDELFKVQFHPEHVECMAVRGWIFMRNVHGRAEPYMNHTRLIEAIEEMAL